MPENITTTEIKTTELALILHKARKDALEVPPLSKTFREFPLAEAYKIQAAGIKMRMKDGEKIVGFKMGLTSKAKMEQMGLHTPIYGVLTDKMQIKNGAEFSLKGKIHPKTEPEIYFKTKTALRGKITPQEALAACSEIGVALEILDSRYTGFKYFTLPDVVADNSSSAYFVLGESIKNFDGVPFSELSIDIRENGTVAFDATGAAILGDPLMSLVELVRLLDEHSATLLAGSIVLAGAATQAVELQAGKKMSAVLDRVGQASFTVSKSLK